MTDELTHTSVPQPTAPDVERVVGALRGMAYEHRLRILMLLMPAQGSSPTELAEALPLDASTVSHHLRHLLDARLIRRQRRGRHVVYTLRDEATLRLIGEVMRFGTGRPPC